MRARNQPPLNIAEVLEEELDAGTGAPPPGDIPKSNPEERLASTIGRIHSQSPHRSALCLSGGGIRSATFCLGVLQALAQRGLLKQFDYLSTVSGGGYVGGWLSAWIRNCGIDQVLAALRTPREAGTAPEVEPIRHLRAYSNFLTPKLGFFSADTWTLVAIFLRNLLLNWLVLLSWLALVLLIPGFCAAAVMSQPPPWTLWIWATLAFASITFATAYPALDLPGIGNSKWDQRRFLLCWLLPMGILAVSACAFWAFYRNTIPGAADQLKAGLTSAPILVGFISTASLAGCLIAACVLLLRNRKKEGAVPRSRRPGMVAGAVLATVLVSGAFGGTSLWLAAACVFPNPAQQLQNFICFGPALILGGFAVLNFLFVGLVSWISGDDDREWWGRACGLVLIVVVVWVALSALALWGPLLMHFLKSGPVLEWILGTSGGVLGLLTALAGFSGITGATKESAHKSTLILAGAALFFFLSLSLLMSQIFYGGLLEPKVSYLEGGSFLEANMGDLWDETIRHAFLLRVLTAGAILLGVGAAMGFFINVNKFSLHSVYRNRLIRAFLAASRTKAQRDPHRFTGFDPADNPNICDLAPGKPFHVVNLALNLADVKQLSWQERMAASFTMSRLHSGGWNIGYRPSREYAAGLSFGTALTISGAAANPNMGYHSSALVRFLMTLFNVRLGWWLGNPGPAGAATWKKRGPTYAVGPLFSEAVGRTNRFYPYVNLSDGGHFDNLGLYEMVLRRCHFIVAIDAGRDTDFVFADLGNAIRKIRIDFGIPIDIALSSPKAKNPEIPRCALGRIKYSATDGEGTDGFLLYIKPLLFGDEPADVRNYAAANPEFPHESTADQWFTESQLESYRALGQHIIEHICAKRECTIPELFTEVERALAEHIRRSKEKRETARQESGNS